MSKKLIAVLSAAALALTALVAVPASATTLQPFVVAVSGQTSGNGATSDSPAVINVPSQNVMRYVDDPIGDEKISVSVIRLDIDATTTSAAVRVVATGGAKLLTEAQYDAGTAKVATGVASLDLTSDKDDADVVVYAFTTSTGKDTITVTNAGNSKVVHIQGSNKVDYIYNINFTAPASANISSVLTLTGTVTDAFGNKVEGLLAQPLSVDTFGVAGSASGGEDAWAEDEDSAGTYSFGVDTSSTSGSGTVILSKSIATVTAFGAPRSYQLITFGTASLADQVASLTAQVAALQATVAKKVTKKRYNTLARKWNKAFPTQKVALKK
jgi:hypothetical protein